MNNISISYISPHILADLPKDSSVLLAFSGGADSSALLHLLAKDSKERGFSLSVAHFHHGIRGDEADRDADFCKKAAEEYAVPFYFESADIPTLAKANGSSIEAEARERRYAFFEKIMKENDIFILVTAHHAEDQVESILLHALRGSGIGGICGMQPCRPFANGRYLVRPLLNAEKSDILSYCESEGIRFVTDSTNSDTSYLRNAIRAEITPKMRELQPNICSAFARLAESAKEANDFIDFSAREFISAECSDRVPLNKFNSLFAAVKSRVLTILFEQKCSATLEHVHIKSIIELCEKASLHSSLSLPGRFSAIIENNALIFSNEVNDDTPESFDVPFREGKIQLPNGVVINVEKNPAEEIQNDTVILDVPCHSINDGAHFRSRAEGDVIFSGKMNKKVKKLLSEKKISLDVRKKLPLLLSHDDILWVPTVALCDELRKSKIRCGEDFYRITITM